MVGIKDQLRVEIVEHQKDVGDDLFDFEKIEFNELFRFYRLFFGNLNLEKM